MYKHKEGYKGPQWDMETKRFFCVICGHDNVRIDMVGCGSVSGTKVLTKCPDCSARGNINNTKTHWYGSELTRAEVESIFTLAKIEIWDMKQTANGYHENGRADEYGERQFWHYWWMVKTKYGWIEIGWRKRVISINWSDTKVRTTVPSPSHEGRTRDDTGSHAYSVQEAITDLTYWNKKAEEIGG